MYRLFNNEEWVYVLQVWVCWRYNNSLQQQDLSLRIVEINTRDGLPQRILSCSPFPNDHCWYMKALRERNASRIILISQIIGYTYDAPISVDCCKVDVSMACFQQRIGCFIILSRSRETVTNVVGELFFHLLCPHIRPSPFLFTAAGLAVTHCSELSLTHEFSCPSVKLRRLLEYETHLPGDASNTNIDEWDVLYSISNYLSYDVLQ